MQRSRRVALVLLAVCLLAAGALANDLETHLSIICRPPDGFCQLTDEGIPDRPAMGNATFSNTPWSFQFVTAKPISYTYNDAEYLATFGAGGMFQMTGPDNLTFTGQILSGSEYQYFEGNFDYKIDLMFDGMWSNNVAGYGEVTIGGAENFADHATLDAYTAPEPTGLALLSSGGLGIWAAFRRRIRG